MEQITELTARMKPHARITVMTGAGISAASGVPTFRGPGGLWKSYRPEQLATPEAFGRDPRLVWEWYNWRRELISKCSPNPGHEVLSRWSVRYPGFTLITQNVDGLHEKAGTRNVLRFHGSIWEVLCWEGCPGSPARWLDFSVPLPEIPPKCPHCGGLMRPGVVWFGEGIDPEIMESSTVAIDCDLFLAIGTSAIVYPAAGFIAEARRRGALTVEINLEPTPSSGSVDLVLQGSADIVLKQVEQLLTGCA